VSHAEALELAGRVLKRLERGSGGPEEGGAGAAAKVVARSEFRIHRFPADARRGRAFH